MGNCNFVKKLNKLSKSSTDAIDHLEKFDDLKKYMHVTREVENILKDILRNVNASEKKTLVLLCGNAGDGKSHLLSYLKNLDKEQLLQNWIVHNDATESSSPTKTAIESLNELLTPFNDENIQSEGKNIIVAINLGVLNNFITKYQEKFSNLKEYIEKNDILKSDINHKVNNDHEHFKHVSFSDFHIYSLTENGVHSKYIEDILNKIFSENEENIFFNSYKRECDSCRCTLSEKCPVKKNYEYLMDEKRRKFIENLLITIMIQDKAILTTREILNIVYDIIVSHNFDRDKSYTNNDSEYLQEFISQLTPTLIFESNNLMQHHDPLLDRTEEADEESMLYYVSSDVSETITSEFTKIPYGEIICKDNYLKLENENNRIKSQLFKLLVRIKSIENNNNDEVYQNYLKYLYFYNVGNKREFRNLYTIVTDSIYNYCGKKDDYICFDERFQDLGIRLYEKIDFNNSYLNNLPDVPDTKELQQFIPFIQVSFENPQGKPITLDVHYSLYKMMMQLKKGYFLTANDKIMYANFIAFIRNILKIGKLKEDILIAFNDGQKAKMSKVFGISTFEVIK